MITTNILRPLATVPQITRLFATQAKKAQITPQQLEAARKTAQEISEKFDSHHARHHPFFPYLEEQAKTGFTAAQYNAWAPNFAFRTIGTVKTVAQVIARAIANSDLETASQTGKNLFEETGSGNLKNMHLALLDYCIQTHGKRVFGLPEFNTLQPDPSQLIPEVIAFRKAQNKALSPSYDYMRLLGRLAAHEGAADDMLITFHKTLFEPYKGYYTKEEYGKLEEYFKEHRDDSKEGGDVEAQHKEAALAVIAKAIATHPKSGASKIEQGGMEFLKSQDALWTGLLREMENAKNSGYPIPPKIDFRKENSRPQSSPKPVDSAAMLTKEKVIGV